MPDPETYIKQLVRTPAPLLAGGRELSLWSEPEPPWPRVRRSVRQDRHAGLRLFPERITQGARLRLTGRGSLQPIELPRGVVAGHHDTGCQAAELRTKAPL